MGNLSAQNLSNMAWAFAMVRRPEEMIFVALSSRAEQCMGDFSAQDLANTAWAFAVAWA